MMPVGQGIERVQRRGIAGCWVYAEQGPGARFASGITDAEQVRIVAVRSQEERADRVGSLNGVGEGMQDRIGV